MTQASALGVPSFVTQPELWDFITFVTKNGQQFTFETEVSVNVVKETDVDDQKPKQADQQTTKPQGKKPPMVDVTFVLYTDQHVADYMSLCALIEPIDGKTNLDPFTIVHPDIAIERIGPVTLRTKSAPPISKKDQKKTIAMKCKAWSPKPKTAAKQGPAKNLSDAQKTAALQAQLDALQAQKKVIIAQGGGVDAYQAVDEKMDAVRKQMPKPPPSVSNSGP